MADPDITLERDDDPSRHDEEIMQRIGVPLFNWAGLLGAAIVHASDPARADVPALVGLPWIPTGPRNLGGRIRALAQDRREPATIYAGSGIGGMWKTLNGGDTWTPLDDFRPPNPPNAVRQALPIGAVAIAPSNRQILYVGTGEPSLKTDSTGAVIDRRVSGTGLYRSTDAGTTFEMIDRVAPGPPGTPPSIIGARRFERILVDPWEPRRLWVASPKGLWRGEPPGAGAPGLPPVFTQDVVTGAGVPVAANQDASDIVIDFGGRSAALDFDPTTDAPPAQFTVYVAMRSVGIFRRTFDRATAVYTGAWTKLDDGIREKKFHRIKIALCTTRPNILYAVFGLRDNSASRVYKSDNRGDSWHRTAKRPGDDGEQAYYDLVLETHPEQPEIVFTASVDLFRSINAGESWEKVMDWTKFDNGDRAQHADHHAFLFDGLEPRKIWVGNDGGISMSRDLGNAWRKRSHGILTAQFYDITVHPVFPFIMGGGLHDMGTWVSFGGETWYYLNGGDGGQIGFDPTTPQQFFVTTQNNVRLRNISTNTGPMGSSRFLTPLPDVPLVPTLPGATPITKLQSVMTLLPPGFDPAHTAPFVGILEQHPVVANHALAGRKQGAYLCRDGATFELLNTGAFNLVGDEVSALAYAPNSPNNDWWCGTSGGEVFHTTTGTIALAPLIATIVWTRIILPGIVMPVAPATATARISDIAVHPGNASIVAIAVAMTTGPGRVYLTGDGGTTWQEISGRTAGLVSPPEDQLSPSPILSVVFDPHSPAAVASAQTLYVGTIAGVYVIRNAMPPIPAAPAPPTPVWRTFNNGLPLAVIQDFATVVERDGLGNITRAALCCATLGRGIYECDLAGTPVARLFIRQTPIDNGRTYVGAANLPTDPRQSPMPVLPPDQAFDIRVDCPPFSFFQGVKEGAEFDEVLDGVEFDEELRSDQPTAGERNLVYVQVHTGGTAMLVDVQVHLFFADAAAAPGGAVWQAIDPPQPVTVGPAQPAVARFEWTPPGNVPNPVALLALCTHPQDPIPALPPGVVVDPANPAVFLSTEPRAALRNVAVTPFVGDVYVRDGIDDDGSPGSVAWGARSPDIIVLQAPEADPDATFNDLADRRPADKIKGGVTNHIYVRVHNRRNVPLSADVDLYQVPFATMEQVGTWVRLGAAIAVNDIPAKGWKFTPAIQFANPPDPDPLSSHPYRVYLLVAIVSRADDPMPNIAAITSLDLFWQFFLRQPIGNNAAMRALRFEP